MYFYADQPKDLGVASPDEQKEIWLAKDSPIEIRVSVLFSLNGGNCSGEFKKTWHFNKINS